MKGWLYSRQPREEWPDWLAGTNSVRDPQTGRVLLHRLWACHFIFPGDCIALLPDGDIQIEAIDDPEAQ